MKHLTLFFLLCSFLSCKTEVKDHYEITAKSSGIYNGMRAYLKVVNERGKLINKDTAIVLDEKFAFKGMRNEPSLEYLFIDGYNGYLPVIVENGLISIEINKDSIAASTVSGTPTNDVYSKFAMQERLLNNKIRLLTEQFRQATINNAPNKSEFYGEIITSRNALSNLISTFIESNKESFASAFLLNNILNNKQISIPELESKFNGLSAEIQNSNYGKNLALKIEKQKQLRQQQKGVEIGDKAPNFSAQTPEGKTLALNDVKGKVTLIDFWASWCGPCRKENPNVVEAYKQFHNKGFEIISVSLDKSNQKDKWLKAIKTDNMTWHHVSNLKSWNDPIAKAYGVHSIPATFILDENRNVIAKNLRGPALGNKLKELLH